MAETSRPSAAEEPPGAAQPAPQPARRRRVLPAAIVGGVIGAAIVAALGWAWLRPELDRSAELRRIAALEQQVGRLSALEQQLARLEPVERQLGTLAELPQRLARLEPLAGRLEALEQRMPELARAGEQVAALGRRLDELSAATARLDRLEALAGELGQTRQQLAQTQQELARLARLEQELARQAGDLGGLGHRLAALDQARAELAERLRAVDLKSESVTTFPAALEGLSRKLDAAVQAVEGRAGERARGLEVAIAQLEERVKLALQQPGELAALGGALKALEQRLAQIDAKIARDRSTTDTALGELREQVRAADVQVDALALALDNLRRTHPDLARMTDEVGGLKGELAAVRAEIGAVKAALGGLEGELGGLRGALAPLQGAQAALETRLGALDGGLEKLREAQIALVRADEGLAARLGQTREEFARTVAELRDGLAGEIAGTRGEVAALGKAVGEGFAERDRAIGQLRDGLAALTKPVDRRPQAVALALGELGEALARGGPLAEPLRTLEEAGAQDPVIGEAVALLRPAAAGVPTLPELRQRFERVIGAFAQPEPAKPSAEAGIGERLLGQLSSVVTVKRVGGPHAAAVEAARTALARDDLAAAVAALAGVPPADNPALPGWLAEAKKRLDAEAGIARLRGHLRTLLTAAG